MKHKIIFLLFAMLIAGSASATQSIQIESKALAAKVSGPALSAALGIADKSRFLIEELSPSQTSISKIVLHDDNFPEIASYNDTIYISIGAVAFLANKDELAFQLSLALAGSPSLSDVQAHKKIIEAFILNTKYNPSAAIEHYRRVAAISKSQAENHALKNYVSIAKLNYSEEAARIQRDLVKYLIKDFAYSTKDLSERLDDFFSLDEAPESKTAREELAKGIQHFFSQPLPEVKEETPQERSPPPDHDRLALQPNTKTDMEALEAYISGIATSDSLLESHSPFIPGICKPGESYNSCVVQRWDQLTKWVYPLRVKAYETKLNLMLAKGMTLEPFQALMLDTNDYKFVKTSRFVQKFSSCLRYDKLSAAERKYIYSNGTCSDRQLFIALRFLNDLDKNPSTEAFLEGIEAYNSLQRCSDKSGFSDFKVMAAEFVQTHCHRIIDNNHEAVLRPRGEDSPETYKCLVDNVHKVTTLERFFAQMEIVNTHRKIDMRQLKKMMDKFKLFLRNYDDALSLVSAVNHNITRKSQSFEVASTLGEFLTNNSRLVRNMEDVNAILESDYFWTNHGNNSKSLDQMIKDGVKGIEHANLGYNIEVTERLQRLLILVAKTQLTERMSDEWVTLWHKLVKRGVTPYTDKLFDDIMRSDLDRSVKTLMQEQIYAGRIHNREAKKEAVRAKVASLPEFKQLKELDPIKDAGSRQAAHRVIKDITLNALGVSLAQAELLDEFAIQSEATEAETADYKAAKLNYQKTVKADSEDLFDLVGAVLKESRKWPKEQQWNLALFLVAHESSLNEKTVQFIRKLSLTPLRLFDIFNSVSNEYQIAAMDTLLSQEGGVLSEENADSEWTQKVIYYVLGFAKPSARQVAKELLGAYMYALSTPGLKYFKSLLFAHLLVASKKGPKDLQVLAEICKHFGAFGIKIGQFLLATGVLPEEENSSLRDLEDDARSPSREVIFKDLREIYGDKPIPYRIKKVIGGASLKYVVLAQREGDGETVVLKILAKDALVHTPLEEKLLKRMADYLVKTQGQKYGAFKSAIYASAEAIRRELDFKREAEHSKDALKYMYKDCSTRAVKVGSVEDRYLYPRLIEANFAQGESINKLSHTIGQEIGRIIDNCETQNLFPDTSDPLALVHFDPDRHPGNYRVTEYSVMGIDFGQLKRFTVKERDRIFELIAIANVLNEIGRRGHYQMILVIDDLSRKICALFDAKLSIDETDNLSKELANTFLEHQGEGGVTPYYRLLSVIDEFGLLHNHGEDKITLYDLPKGLMHAFRYGNMVKDKMSKVVQQRVDLIADELNRKYDSKLNVLWRMSEVYWKQGSEKTYEWAQGLRDYFKGLGQPDMLLISASSFAVAATVAIPIIACRCRRA